MNALKHCLLILTLALSAVARAEETDVDRLKRLGYADLPKVLNTVTGKTEFRLPTELECQFYPASPTVPLRKNACFYYLQAAYAAPPAMESPPGSYSAFLDPYDGDVDRFQAWVNRGKSIDKPLEKANGLETFQTPALSLVEETPYSLITAGQTDLILSSRFRHLGRFLCDRGFLYEERGDLDKALTSYLQVMRLGTGLTESKGGVIFILIGNALTRMGGQCVADLAGTHKLNDRQLQLAEKTIRELPDVYPKMVDLHAREINLQTELFLDKKRLKQWVAYLEPLIRRALERERKKAKPTRPKTNPMTPTTFDGYGHGLDDVAEDLLKNYRKQLNVSDTDRKTFGVLFKKKLSPEFKRATLMSPAAARRHYSEKGEALWKEIEKAFPTLKRHAIRKELAEKTARELAEDWITTIPKEQRLPIVATWQFGIQTYPILSSYGRRGAKDAIWKGCLTTKLALERYYLKHKQYPQTLNALVPAFLKAVPIDPYNAKPLAYTVNGTSWVVYSVGEDGKDDGGETVGIDFYSRATDLGMRSFSVTNSQRRREVAKVLWDLHKKGVRSKVDISRHLKEKGFVLYRGLWIKKDIAVKRRNREKN